MYFYNPDNEYLESAVGGLWDTVGNLQYNYLLKEGLKPNNNLLDVCCGSFRVGRFLIEYLEKNRYYGFDYNKHLIKEGVNKVLNSIENLEDKIDLSTQIRQLTIDENFIEYDSIYRKMDYIWIHAVADHIEPDIFLRHLCDMSKIMHNESKMFVTIFLDENDVEMIDRKWGTTHKNKEYWHHTIDMINKKIESVLEIKEVDKNYDHPLGLVMLKIQLKD